MSHIKLPALHTLIDRADRWARELGAGGAHQVSPVEAEELRRCRGDFQHFCRNYVYIQDKQTKRDALFELFPGQARVAPDMVAGTWLVLLKGRQLGLTWLCCAYVVWRLVFERSFCCVVINQEKQYAQDFVWRVRFIEERLPPWCRKALTKSDMTRLRMEAFGNQGDLRAVVGGEKAARSVTADLVIIDEASRVDDLEATMAAIHPTVDVSRGQIIMLSSSAGPQGVFHECWAESYGLSGELLSPDGIGPNGFKPVFIHWSERRGRDAAWHEKTTRELRKISPVRMKQEHPENPQEAWEYASGRVYPLFTRERCVGDVPVPDTAERFRAIDWGQTDSPFVCLWIAHIPGPTQLLVSPKCPELIREMLSYRFDEDRPDEPLKSDDHGPDALRYALTTWYQQITGTVYVYREFYLRDSVERGWNPLDEIAYVHEQSGWGEAPPDRHEKFWPTRYAEQFVGTVADRSWPSMIKLFCAHDLPTVANKPMHKRKRPKDGVLTESPLKERLEGIRRVSVFIEGSRRLEKFVPPSAEQVAMAALRADQARSTSGQPVTVGLNERASLQLAKRLLRSRKRGIRAAARR